MFKILKLFLISILFFSPVFSCELSSETKQELISKLNNSTLVVCKNNEIETFQERGLLPLLIYIKENKTFKNTYAFDKIVGKAAALLYVYAKADWVFANTMSKSAVEVFDKYKIRYEALNIIDEIPNRTKTDICPFEKLTKEINSPRRAYKVISKKFNF